MKIHLAPLPAQPVTEQVIMADTERIGIVKTLSTDNGSTRYHVVLDSRYGKCIYQGFGDTVDEAMKDAIVTGCALRNLELNELDNLENVIWGDHEIN